jgi:hypothetical protein
VGRSLTDTAHQTSPLAQPSKQHRQIPLQFFFQSSEVVVFCMLASAWPARPPRQQPLLVTTDDAFDLHVDVPIPSGLLANFAK